MSTLSQLNDLNNQSSNRKWIEECSTILGAFKQDIETLMKAMLEQPIAETRRTVIERLEASAAIAESKYKTLEVEKGKFSAKQGELRLEGIYRGAFNDVFSGRSKSKHPNRTKDALEIITVHSGCVTRVAVILDKLRAMEEEENDSRTLNLTGNDGDDESAIADFLDD